MGSIRTDHLDLYLILSHHISGSHRSRLGKFLDKNELIGDLPSPGFYIVYLRYFSFLQDWLGIWVTVLLVMLVLLFRFQVNLSLDWYILGENEIILLSYVLCHQLSLLEFFLGESFSVEELL